MPIFQTKKYSAIEKSIHIILITGTFAPKADWVKEESLLVKELRENLKKDCSVEQLHWSSGNSIRARIDGSKLLVELCQRIRNTNPKSKIYIIAHSHGGNVALYGIKQMIGRKEFPDKLVTMGTPFFYFKRDKSHHTFSVLYGICIPLLFWGTVFSILFFLKVEFQNKLFAIILVVVFLLFYIIGYQKALKRSLNNLDHHLHCFKYPDHLSIPILNIKYKIDEARMGLKTINHVLSIPGELQKRTSKDVLACILLLTAGIALIFIGSIIGYPLVLVPLFYVGYLFLKRLSKIFFAFFVNSFPVVSSPFAVLLEFLKYTPVSNGWSNPLIPMFTKLTVSNELPNNYSDVTKAQTSFKLPSFCFGLVHSQYYNDQKIIKQICMFLDDSS